MLEDTNAGIDEVRTNLATYTLGANAERLRYASPDGTPLAGNALLTGNTLANLIVGGLGNDTLASGGGSDTFAGGAGADSIIGPTLTEFSTNNIRAGLDYSSSLLGVVIAASDTGDTLTFSGGDAEGDVVSGRFATFIGSATGANLITGGSPNETIVGGAAADTLLAGSGHDSIVAGAGADSIDAGLLSDTISGGAGADTIDGGADVSFNTNDLVDYSSSGAAVSIDLRLATPQSGGDAEGDVLSRIESITGTAFDDRIVGNASGVVNNQSANQLDGGAGNDTLIGREGSDTLTGGDGNDYLDAGVGRSMFNGTIRVGLNDTAIGTSADASGFTLSAKINNAGNSFFNLYIGATSNGAAADVTNFGFNGYFSGSTLLSNLIGEDAALQLPFHATGNRTLTYVVGDAGSAGGASRTVHFYVDGVLRGIGSTSLPTATGAARNLYVSAAQLTMVDEVVLYRSVLSADQIQQIHQFDSSFVAAPPVVRMDFDGIDPFIASNGQRATAISNISTVTTVENPSSDVLNGGAGNDTLVATAGTNRLSGGVGDDLYVVTAAMTQVELQEDAGAGTDTVRVVLAPGHPTYSLARFSNIEIAEYIGMPREGGGGLAGVVITGSEGGETITPVAGYGEGADTLDGAGGNDSLFSGAGNDLLIGGGGDDTLGGGTGADTLRGGLGNDSFIVENHTNVIEEGAAEGFDTAIIRSSAINVYTLGANIEGLVFQSSGGAVPTYAVRGSGNAGDNSIVGGLASDSLAGFAGNDTLDGGAGWDSMDGGEGDDTYIVDVSSHMSPSFDRISDSGGIDTIRTTAAVGNIIITWYPTIENLIHDGPLGINVTGNDLANRIVGNVGADNLFGGLGNDSLAGGSGIAADTLVGHVGDDTMDGGEGADSMDGGEGSDVYFADSLGDRVNDRGSSGFDVLNASFSTITLNASATIWGIERVVFTGIGSATMLGRNNFADELVGAGGADSIDGFTGDDSLFGAGGADTLAGNVGNDTLDGGAGVDSLVGGAGNDLYVIDSLSDMILEGEGSGTDTVRLGATVTAPVIDMTTMWQHIENVQHLGTGSASITGNVANNALTGGGAADTLTGGTGNDTLSGGSATTSSSVTATRRTPRRSSSPSSALRPRAASGAAQPGRRNP